MSAVSVLVSEAASRVVNEFMKLPQKVSLSSLGEEQGEEGEKKREECEEKYEEREGKREETRKSRRVKPQTDVGSNDLLLLEKV